MQGDTASTEEDEDVTKNILVNPSFDAYLDEMDRAESEVAIQQPILGYP